jgi:hypothetical protein
MPKLNHNILLFSIKPTPFFHYNDKNIKKIKFSILILKLKKIDDIGELKFVKRYFKVMILPWLFFVLHLSQKRLKL